MEIYLLTCCVPELLPNDDMDELVEAVLYTGEVYPSLELAQKDMLEYVQVGDESITALDWQHVCLHSEWTLEQGEFKALIRKVVL